MAFPKQPPRTPTAIGIVRIELLDVPANAPSPPYQTERAEIQILDVNNEELMIFRVDLEEHLSASTIAQLKALLTTVRTKAATELL